MRSKRSRFLSVAALLCVALCAGGLAAPAAPSCIAKYSVAIFEALGEDSQATGKVFQIVKGFGPDAQKGVVAFLGSSTLDGADLSLTFENFAGFQGAAVLDHPLQTGDALFGAIGQISSNVDSVPGFSETLAQLAQDVNTSAAQGAAMDIAVATDYKLTTTLIGFQQIVPSAGGNRIYNVTAHALRAREAFFLMKTRIGLLRFQWTPAGL